VARLAPLATIAFKGQGGTNGRKTEGDKQKGEIVAWWGANGRKSGPWLVLPSLDAQERPPRGLVRGQDQRQGRKGREENAFPEKGPQIEENGLFAEGHTNNKKSYI
jgi:hypothetical protein